MKSIISGSHGFIAKHLINQLEQLKHKVVPIDRYLLANQERLMDFFDKEKPDYIFHLATYGNMSDHNERQAIFQANVINTWNMLIACQSVDYKAFINFSTSSVLLKHETMYSTTKLASEIIVNQFPKTVSIRPSTVIGVGEQSQHLIPTLIRSCLYGEEMPFIAEPSHDFIVVEDVISGVLKVIDSMDKNIRSINISSGKQYTNHQVKKIVELLTGKTANIKLVDDLRVYDTKDWKVDNSKLLSLEWQPLFTLEETITKMIKAQVWN